LPESPLSAPLSPSTAAPLSDVVAQTHAPASPASTIVHPEPHGEGVPPLLLLQVTMNAIALTPQQAKVKQCMKLDFISFLSHVLEQTTYLPSRNLSRRRRARACHSPGAHRVSRLPSPHARSLSLEPVFVGSQAESTPPAGANIAIT
jgi:hypothetical protein